MKGHITLPLYEYQCKKCGHKFEKIQLFSDKPIKKCPECGGAVEKLISRSAVQFKGSGWYATDYAKKSDGGSAGSGKGSGDGDSASNAESAESAKEVKSSDTSESKDAKPKAKSESSGKKSHKK
jgi:putative FmdB family regulatory protein